MSEASVAILGAGRMGRGIALAFARRGVSSVLIDLKPRSDSDFRTLYSEVSKEVELTAQVLGEMDNAQDKALANHITVVARHGIRPALASARVLFEAVPETMEAKREAFAAISEYLPQETIVASTSSTFLSTDIAALVPGPRRCLNAHWLNPAYLIPLVEVSPHEDTDPNVVTEFAAFLEENEKVPVMCAPSAGYIVPRLQTLIMNEAARIVQEGVAKPQDIDKAIRVGFGVRYASMGVLEFVDFGGCDILHYASHYLAGALAADRFGSPEIVAQHMREGRLGLKTGLGFYDWKGLDLEGYRRLLLENLSFHIERAMRSEQAPRPRSAY
ncbi:3-hydroxyacyl-CoA dehydrogenase NAD-binding domain-containing protein [Bradyrhizobium sp. TM239]|uniref:3-hydroxyacyl-CoA dehydrogenase NAD-binding domain-containing protein n=1 Tax=Bradyrhizobium sp. TM239 TaxID=2599802 RepID=UPI0027D6A500|nr:3-hydroxybutyryl-CoA dehydrogenase [Bradyrhizobium sp. TM239]